MKNINNKFVKSNNNSISNVINYMICDRLCYKTSQDEPKLSKVLSIISKLTDVEREILDLSETEDLIDNPSNINSKCHNCDNLKIKDGCFGHNILNMLKF